jgi:hypothetical protein
LSSLADEKRVGSLLRSTATPDPQLDCSLPLAALFAGLPTSWRWPDQEDPNPLPGNRLGRLIDGVVDEDCDDWISTRHRMIGEKDDRLTGGRNLNRAADYTLAGQVLSHSSSVVLQRLTHEAYPDAVAAQGCPLGRH